MEDGTLSNSAANIKKYLKKKTNKSMLEEETEPKVRKSQKSAATKKSKTPAKKTKITNKKEKEQTDHELNVESESDWKQELFELGHCLWKINKFIGNLLLSIPLGIHTLLNLNW